MASFRVDERRLVMFETLFLLIAGHAIMDFPLQGETVAREKNHRSDSELQKHVPWYYWLTAHALSHGLVVFMVTGSLFLALSETASHWIIDHFKCAGMYSIHVDQTLHIMCKIIWTLLWVLITLSNGSFGLAPLQRLVQM